MKVIGVIRNKKDLELFGDLPLPNNYKIKDIWDDELNSRQQLDFPAVVFQFDGEKHYNLYNMLAVKENYYEDELKKQEIKVLDILLQNVLEDTVFSSAEKLVDDVISYLVESKRFDGNVKHMLSVLFSFYNRHKLFFINKNYRAGFKIVKLKEYEDESVDLYLELFIKDNETDVMLSKSTGYVIIDSDILFKILVDIILELDEILYLLHYDRN